MRVHVRAISNEIARSWPLSIDVLGEMAPSPFFAVEKRREKKESKEIILSWLRQCYLFLPSFIQTLVSIEDVQPRLESRLSMRADPHHCLPPPNMTCNRPYGYSLTILRHHSSSGTTGFFFFFLLPNLDLRSDTVCVRAHVSISIGEVSDTPLSNLASIAWIHPD